MAIEALGSTVGEGVKGQGLQSLLSNMNVRQLVQAVRTSIIAQQEHLLLWVPMFLIAGN